MCNTLVELDIVLGELARLAAARTGPPVARLVEHIDEIALLELQVARLLRLIRIQGCRRRCCSKMEMLSHHHR